MNPSRRLGLLLTLAFPLGLLACGGGEPPPPPPAPTVASVSIKAASDVNPDASGAPKPVRVRVYKLKTGQPFVATDFFSLDQDAKAALGDDLVGMDEFIVPPGGTQVWQAKLDEETKVVGVTAAFFDVDQSQWRAWKEIPPNATTLLVADVSGTTIKLREAGL